MGSVEMARGKWECCNIIIMRHQFSPIKHSIHLKESRCIVGLNAIMLKAASKKMSLRMSFEADRTPKGK